MKELFGFDLADIDLDLLSLEDLQEIRAKLTDHYKYIGSFPHGGKKRLQINKFIRSHARVMLTPTLNLTQEMACAIQHIPELRHSSSCGDMNSILVTYLKQALKDEQYKGAHFNDLQNIVDRNQRILDIAHNWESSVMKFRRAVAAENIYASWDILEEICSQHANPPKNCDHRYVSYMLCSQIVNLIDILSEIDRDYLYFDSISEFYTEVCKQLKIAIQNFTALSAKRTNPTVYEKIRGLFFCCLPQHNEADEIAARFAARKQDICKQVKLLQEQGKL